jgi:hypothetical protein
MKNAIRFNVACALVALLATGTAAQAKTLSTWDRTIDGPSRFKLVLDDDGVLDKETGLVWARSPGSSSDWPTAQFNCLASFIGGRYGWRLPTLEELATLVDPSESNPSLPIGHPFVGVSGVYWSSTSSAANAATAWGINFDFANFVISSKASGAKSWCVRGHQGYDGQ